MLNVSQLVRVRKARTLYQIYRNALQKNPSSLIVVRFRDSYRTFDQDAWLTAWYCGDQPELVYGNSSLEMTATDIETMKANRHQVVVVGEVRS